MPSYQSLKDNALLAESYYDNVHARLLLETPATAANINKFIKKYLPRDLEYGINVYRDGHEMVERQNEQRRKRGLPANEPAPFDKEDAHNRVMENLRQLAKQELAKWTPAIQQTIQASGGIADIFGYPDKEAMKAAHESASISKTTAKKAYRKVEGMQAIYETDDYIVYKPETWEASRKYFGISRVSLLDGKVKEGSKWCTAASTSKHFKEYVIDNKDRLLYIITKTDKLRRADSLWAVRSRTLDPELTANVFSQFQKEYLQWINDTGGIGDYEDFGDISAYDQVVVDALHDIEMDLLKDNQYFHPLIEVRDQKNNDYWLSDMVSIFFKNMKNVEDVKKKIIPFIGLVVFGIQPDK